MNNLRFALAFALSLHGLGCSGTSSGSALDGGAANDGDRDAAAGNAGQPLTGTLGDAPFSLGSAMFYLSSGKLNFIFSSRPDVCGQITRRTVDAGSLQLEIYDIPGVTPGDYQSTRATGGHVKDSCSSGTVISASQLEYFETAVQASVTVAAVAPIAVAGRVNVTFADGSVLAGAFSAQSCDDTPHDGTVCR